MKRLLMTGCLLVLTACTNLDAVRDISHRLSTASMAWDDVGGEFANSCIRESSINPLLSDCDLEKKASAGLAGANQVLGNYFKALRESADNSNFTIQPGLDQAAAAAAGIPGIDTKQVTAISGLVGLLSKLATGAIREATLRELIEQGGPSAQIVVRGLDDLVVTRLGRRLETERFQLTGQFGRLLLAQKETVGPDPSTLCSGSAASKFSGVGFLLTLEYCRRLGVIDNRVNALAAYRSSLAVADKALAEMQSSKTKLKAKALAQKLFEVGVDLDDKVAAIRKAFGR